MIVDLKVKIITKSQSKQSVMKNQVSMQKIDIIVANDTGKNQTNFMGITDRLFIQGCLITSRILLFVSLMTRNLSTLMS